MPDHSRALNCVFTRKVLEQLVKNGSNSTFDYVVGRYIDDPSDKSHGQLFSEIYVYLSQDASTRNEYYYTNTLLNRLLAGGQHNVNTTTALSQVWIGDSIADFLMLNGGGRVYEIKSDLDNFVRLEAQLSDYFKAFSKVSVLASINEYERVQHLLAGFGDMGKAVGISILAENGAITRKYRREPLRYDDRLDHTALFKLLRKQEYESIVRSVFGSLPNVQPVLHFKACLAMFREIPILTAQDLVVKELKKRNKITKTVFGSIQPELRSVIYFSGIHRKLDYINELLDSNYRSDHVLPLP